jgi:hypothetical protein
MGFYAGIGSRRTPDDVLDLMERIAAQLSEDGWTLRSGHAPGADQAFERGAGGRAEIFLPWQTFESGVRTDGFTYAEPRVAAYEIASEFHPAWNRCSRGARMLHARNVHQILGYNLDLPVDFVVCWTDGKGGTEQALRIARHYDISISNLHDPDVRAEVEKWVA